MTPGSERVTPGLDETLDAAARTESDLEEELQGLRDFVVLGGPHPLNKRLWLDLEEFEDRLEHLATLLPKEIRRARRICREEQRIIQDAKDEARRVLEEARAEADQLVTTAREEADRLIEASAIRQRALEQAEATLAQAEATSAEIRNNSYAYAQQVIENIIQSLRRLTDSVEQDRAQLEQIRPGGQ
jgi:cell division septum initiation protein DivIVA